MLFLSKCCLMNNPIVSIMKNSLSLVLLLAMLLLVPYTGFAQQILELSLSEAISLGLKQNYQIRVSEAELEIAQNNNKPGAAGAYPSLSFSAVQSNSFDNSESYTRPGKRDKLTSNLLSPSIDLNWTLFDGFRVNITRDNLSALEELSEGLSAVVVENTIQSIILAYYNVLLQEEKLNVFRELKSLSLDRYEYMQERKKFGSAVTFDVLQSKDAFLSDSVNYLQQDLGLQEANLLLRLLLALDEQQLLKLIDDFAVEMNDYVLDSLINRMYRSNKTLCNQYINQKLYENSTALARSEYYPALYFGAGADYSNTRLKYDPGSDNTAYAFGYYASFSLSFNLFNGGATRRAVQNAQINEEIGNINISELRKTLGNSLHNQFILFGIRKKLVLTAGASVQTTGLNMELAAEKFRAGAINSFNYRDIQLNYRNASLRKLEAMYNLISAETELLRLTGGIINEY